jgi:hypothetical protein
MNNLFGQLYLDLSERIKTEVPEIRWIDQDFGQLERFEYRPEVTFPCALIDFIQANYSNLSQLVQVGEVTVNIRLGFSPFSQAYHAAPTDVKEKALEYYSIEQKVFEAVQGWQPDPPADWILDEPYAQPFIRVSSTTEQRDNDAIGLRVRVLTFTTGFEDETAIIKYKKTPASLEFDNEIIEP